MTDTPHDRPFAPPADADRPERVRGSVCRRLKWLLCEQPPQDVVERKRRRAEKERSWWKARPGCLSLIARSWFLVRDTLARTQGFLFIMGLMLVLSLALCLLSQGADMLTTLAEPTTPSPSSGPSAAWAWLSNFRGWLCTPAALLLMSLQAWFWMRRIVEVEYGLGEPKRAGRRVWGPAWPFLTWAPRITGATPMTVVTITVVAHWRQGMADPSVRWPPLADYAGFAAANAGYWLFVLFRKRGSDDAGGRSALYDDCILECRRWTGWMAWPLGYLAASLALLAIFTVWPLGLAKALGPAAVVFLAAACVLPGMTVLLQLGQILRLPVLALLLLELSLASSLNGCQHDVGRRWPWRGPQAFPVSSADDPPIDRVGRPAAEAPIPAALHGRPPLDHIPVYVDERPGLDDALTAWRQSQRLDAPPQSVPARQVGSVPFVVVATEGGASRAGYWTAVALENLQAMTCNSFSQHLFAISAISGGGVGAIGWIASLPRTPSKPSSPAPCAPPAAAAGAIPPETSLDRFAGEDALSPTLAAMLFPDLVQRFVPFDLLPDRARAIESAWEAAWSGDFPGSDDRLNPKLSRPFLDLWKVPPQQTKPRVWLPIAVIGGAWEETGRRVLTSPVRLDAAFPEGDTDDFYDLYGRDIAASTAIHNGARFPWVSPAGRVAGPGGGGRHIVDGGYFDASGVDAAVAILKYAAARDPRLKPILIVIRYRDAFTKPTPAARFLNDMLAPLRGGAASRDAMQAHFEQAPPAYAVAAPEAIAQPGGDRHDPYRVVQLAGGGPQFVELYRRSCEGLPLNWALSDKAKRFTRALGEDQRTIDQLSEAAKLVSDGHIPSPLPGKLVKTDDFRCL